MIYVGTAGWTLYRAADAFPVAGTILERYAAVLPAVEVNSSFYRSHSPTTYAKWAACTPRRFRFAVKLPQEITHEERLRRSRRPLESFLAETRGLGRRLGPLLVQLPPSLEFESRIARRFFGMLRQMHDGPVVCEPRHQSWFTERAEAVLVEHRVGRVAADPATVPAAARPGGWPGVAYWRLHGSPRKYWSVYDTERLRRWAAAALALPRRTDAWCVFDNTAGGGAVRNALEFAALVGGPRGRHVAAVHDRPRRRPRAA
ncbi:MAG TPA: DUF72 domain-containing protein [Steroidobacteraceae bacterium]|nr:DUF72 domain-containing protein [Steroidobacteraceae bacterium]